jgi:hypothetical protein
MTTHSTSLVTHSRDHWWTLDFANAFVSPGINSRAELVPSPRAYARNGAPRRWLGDDNYSVRIYKACASSATYLDIIYKASRSKSDKDRKREIQIHVGNQVYGSF